MRVLCLETSAAICSVALLDENDAVLVRYGSSVNNHAESVFQLVHEILESSGLKISELDAIALSDGPGSYTGLRIGASSAKGMCFAANLPLIAISTLESMAITVFDSDPEAEWVWPMIDARRQEVYHAIYNRNMEVLLSPAAGIITDSDFIPEELNHQKELVRLCGDGSAKATDILGIRRSEIAQDAVHLVQPAQWSYMEGKFVDLAVYEPFYLKSANITQSKKTLI